MINLKLTSLWVSVLLFFAHSASALVSGAGEATLNVNNDWGSGYCAEVTVANNGSANITGWTIEIDPNDSTISNLWSGNLSGTTVTPLGYNATIAPGNSV